MSPPGPSIRHCREERLPPSRRRLRPSPGWVVVVGRGEGARLEHQAPGKEICQLNFHLEYLLFSRGYSKYLRGRKIPKRCDGVVVELLLLRGVAGVLPSLLAVALLFKVRSGFLQNEGIFETEKK